MNEVAKTEPRAEPKPMPTANKNIAGIVPQTLDEAFRLASALARSGNMVPQHFQGQPDAIMAAVLRGAEIGMAPMQALSNIAVINGRATIWGDALPALAMNAGHHVDVEVTGEGDKMVATATLERGDTGKRYVRTFSMADAVRANLAGKKGPWQDYPSRMLSHRARSWAIRDGAPDALMGLQVAEEVMDYPTHARDVTPQRESLEDRLAKRDQEPQQSHGEASQEPEPEIEDAVTVEAPDPSQGAPMDEEWKEGMDAQKSGAPYDTNPYADHIEKVDDANSWAGGWKAAEAMDAPKE